MDIKHENSDSREAIGLTSFSIVEKLLKREDRPLGYILDKISIGIIILNFRKRTLIFTNNYYNSLVPNHKKDEILTNIYKYIDATINTRKKFDISQDLVIKGKGKELLLSYTTYQVSDEIFVVLLDEVASGIMYFLTKQENQYYNKLSDLIAEMVHEIGNPLSGINTSLQVLLHNISTWPLEKITDYIERTINEINRLSEFLSRMREVSDENKLVIKPTNLKKTLHKVLLQNEDLLIKNGITYKSIVKEDIFVSIDEVAFHQIILNLLNNSLQILSPGKEIRIYVEEVDEFYVRLVYRNNGDPIPEELMEKIFSPLYTTKAKRKGIGLAISLKLMARMGGAMKAVPPEDGIGAKFVLHVPNSSQGKKEIAESEE